MCLSSAQDTHAQLFTGRVLATDPALVEAGPPRYVVIFVESCEKAGRPAVQGDGVNGAGARVLTLPEWVGVYGKCVDSWLYAWVYRSKDEGAK